MALMNSEWEIRDSANEEENDIILRLTWKSSPKGIEFSSIVDDNLVCQIVNQLEDIVSDTIGAVIQAHNNHHTYHEGIEEIEDMTNGR